MINISKKKLIIIVIVAIIVGIFPLLIIGIDNQIIVTKEIKKDQEKTYLEENENQKSLTVKFYDEKSFYDSLAWLKKNAEVFPNCDVATAVVPHHNLAAHMVAGLFSKLSTQNIETVVIVGPNHYENGESIITSDAAWETKFGKVYPNQQIIQDLQKNKSAQIADKIIQDDHSISGLLPMLKYYMPNVKLVPLMLSAKNSQNDMKKLNDKLKDILSNEKVVLVASADFSHYLNQPDAEKNDKVTLDIINSFDYEELYRLGNDNVDSPVSIATFLSAAQTFGDEDVKVIDHANSADFLGPNIAKTTSYYSLVSCRKNK